MAVKSTIAEAPSPDMKMGDLYVGKRSGVVVMVTAPPMNPPWEKAFSGVVLNSDQKEYPIGHHQEDWVVEAFRPFRDAITLEHTP